MTSELKPAAHVLSEYWHYQGVYSYGEEYCSEDQELLEHMEAVDAENEALKQRIAELENEGWKTIDTAPRDGTEFVALDAEYNEVAICMYREWEEDGYKEYGFFNIEDEKHELVPTHWQPLPKGENK